MNLRKELLGGLVSLLLSAGIILGSFSLTLIETKAVKIIALLPSATQQPTLERPTVPAGSPTLTLEPTSTPTITPTPIPPTNCPPPAGWQAYTTRHGDTLESLATQYNTTKEKIMQANCMVVGTLLPNTTIYLPPPNTPTPSPSATASPTLPFTPTITLTKAVCGNPPYGWILYTVRSGDTLFHLAWAYGVSVYELQVANCMDGSTLLLAGSRIYVPNVATLAFSPTPATPTITPSRTLSPVYSPTPTQTAIHTMTLTSTHTIIMTATGTFTAIPTDTTIPANTTTPTEIPTGTSAPAPTVAPTGPAYP